MADATEPRPEPSGCRITLGGLMVIMLVISLAAALFIPSLIAAKEAANRASCGGNLSQLYKGMFVYASTFGKRKDLWMPHTGDAFFTCLLGHSSPEHPASYLTNAPFIGIPEVFLCPSSGSSVNSVIPGGAMADFLGPARHPQVPAGNPSALVSDGIPSDTPIGCDKPGNHRGGGNVLRFDGSVSFREDPDYTAAVKACSD